MARERQVASCLAGVGALLGSHTTSLSDLLALLAPLTQARLPQPAAPLGSPTLEVMAARQAAAVAAGGAGAAGGANKGQQGASIDAWTIGTLLRSIEKMVLSPPTAR